MPSSHGSYSLSLSLCPPATRSTDLLHQQHNAAPTHSPRPPAYGSHGVCHLLRQLCPWYQEVISTMDGPFEQFLEHPKSPTSLTLQPLASPTTLSLASNISSTYTTSSPGRPFTPSYMSAKLRRDILRQHLIESGRARRVSSFCKPCPAQCLTPDSDSTHEQHDITVSTAVLHWLGVRG
jgi:hypothetical protein